jgi:mRNA interferase MazF
LKFVAGETVIVDWRDALPKEPNKRRPGIVVEDPDLFDETYPNVVVVPLTKDDGFSVPGLVVRIAPNASNRLTEPSNALCHHLASVSKQRVTRIGGRVVPAQLADIRRAIALAIGLDDVP